MSQKKIFISFFVLTFLIYGSSLFGGFVFDDRGIQEHSLMLSSIGNLPETALNPYWNIEDKLYRPTTLVSYALNIIILGGSAFSFHLINLLLYFGICSLIYLLLRDLCWSSQEHQHRDEWFPYLAALLFLVLPIHSEVVANITGR